MTCDLVRIFNGLVPDRAPRLYNMTDLLSHAIVQERPCTRCVKRNIGHLCHDEPREPVKTAKGEQDLIVGDEEAVFKQEEISSNGQPSLLDQRQADQQLLQETGLDLGVTVPSVNGQRDSSQLAPPSAVPRSQPQGLGGKPNSCRWMATGHGFRHH